MSTEQKEQDTSEHARLSRLIVEKMHAPGNMHDKQIHTNIPKAILTNVVMMDAIEHGLRKLTDADQVMLDPTRKKVILLKPDPLTGDMLPYREINQSAWQRSQFYAEAMSGLTGNLLEALMSVPVKNGEGGWRAEQAVDEVSSLTNSERQLLEAQNQAKPGILKRLLRRT